MLESEDLLVAHRLERNMSSKPQKKASVSHNVAHSPTFPVQAQSARINVACQHQLDSMNNPATVEQGILDVFMRAFKQYLSADSEYDSKLRWIKQQFVNRNYTAIFNNDAGLLQIYSATYAPYRALL